ncbi:PEP-CTERM sorting domain-containing protein [Phycisphaera mikurensis]|uniref:Ice-binding protein C-terminal domain-containing protein n=1 Tax=Phycisphaera mikurensis (strain NBRC 102666 / KCTC 22515 / FYK2301M01) TaxID=1142394 RepID=I0IFM1_PHYMF|nr:PEP-CTERM sorting domain-containing protein [Phycisphaera mikurensis]MBB6440550.1 hypothetical protein [Phycisphaera mikurensis]BAM04059.1 hypothetical protein PSMK_19000 [Phycisphaera mikurensis NBRC 102666]
MNRLFSVLAASAVAASSTSAFGAAGIFGAYVELTASGGAATSYNLLVPGSSPLSDFDGLDLGDFDVTGDTLVISNAQGLTFKNGGSDVTGVETNYRVTRVGDAPGVFTAIAHNFGANATFTDAAGNTFTGGGDQLWGGPGGITSTPDVVAGLVEGDYEIEIFARAFTAADGDQLADNGGSNYTATFSVVPEPASLALLGAGAALLFRRRRA